MPIAKSRTLKKGNLITVLAKKPTEIRQRVLVIDVGGKPTQSGRDFKLNPRSAPEVTRTRVLGVVGKKRHHYSNPL